jgi:chemotaxis protein CheD
VTETRRVVRVSHAEVASDEEVLVTLGLGSCVAIMLHDPVARIGGLAHVLLPETRDSEPPANPAKFANTAVPHLVAAMRRSGADPGRLRARLVGGASMFGLLLSQDRLHTGVRNLNAARAALSAAGIPVDGEEVGREHGRSVYFYPASGRVRVTSYQFDEVEL